MTEQNSPAAATAAPKQKVGLFDLRWIIAILFGVYGVVVTVMGIGFTTQAELNNAGGINVNLWTGIPMLVFAILMAAWAKWRPVIIEAPRPEDLPPAEAADAKTDVA
jgi:hypothetical protein